MILFDDADMIRMLGAFQELWHEFKTARLVWIAAFQPMDPLNPYRSDMRQKYELVKKMDRKIIRHAKRKGYIPKDEQATLL